MAVLITTSAVRAAFDTAVGAAADRLGALGLRPNHLTWFSLAPAAASLWGAARGYFVFAVVMMALGGLCDLLDGPLARRSGQTSVFGALLDSTLDRFADAAPLLGLVYFYAAYPLPALIAAGAAFSGFAVSYVRARAEGLRIALPWLWMRRTERLLLTGIGLLLAPVPIAGTTAPAPATLATTAIVAVLSLAAMFHALWEASRLTSKAP